MLEALLVVGSSGPDSKREAERNIAEVDPASRGIPMRQVGLLSCIKSDHYWAVLLHSCMS